MANDDQVEDTLPTRSISSGHSSQNTPHSSQTVTGTDITTNMTEWQYHIVICGHWLTQLIERDNAEQYININSHRDPVSNTEFHICDRTPQVQAQQLRWLGHQLRQPESDLIQRFCLRDHPTANDGRVREVLPIEGISPGYSTTHPQLPKVLQQTATNRTDWLGRPRDSKRKSFKKSIEKWGARVYY